MAIKLSGHFIDDQTRCVHYHSALDVIAIKFKCCQTYYPCYQCHEIEARHPAILWEIEEFDELAILCGVCKNEISINAYLNCHNHCPRCSAPFNPHCAKHYSLYFSNL